MSYDNNFNYVSKQTKNSVYRVKIEDIYTHGSTWTCGL